MAATEKQTISFYQSEDGSRPPTRTVKIAASQGVWMPGALGFVSESGTFKLADAATDGNSAYHGLILGNISSEAAANTEFRMSVLRSTDIYQVYIEASGTDTAEAQAFVGNDYGLVRSATAGEIGYVSLDTDATTNTAVTVVDIMSNLDPEKFDTSTASGVALVKFKQTVIERQHA